MRLDCGALMQANEKPTDSRRGYLSVPADLLAEPVFVALADQTGEFAPESTEWVRVFEGDLAGAGIQSIPTRRLRFRGQARVNVCADNAQAKTWIGPRGGSRCRSA